MVKLLPLQWAAVVVVVIDAIVVVTGAVTGAALLPAQANLVLALAGAALLVVLLVQTGGGFRIDGSSALRLLRETLPTWAIALAAVAFYGGWLIGFLGLVTGSVDSGSEAAIQRVWAGFSLAFAGAVGSMQAVWKDQRETEPSVTES